MGRLAPYNSLGLPVLLGTDVSPPSEAGMGLDWAYWSPNPSAVLTAGSGSRLNQDEKFQLLSGSPWDNLI